MALPAIVQSPAGQASSANSPTSLVVSWASTVAGNFLALMVTVTGSNPTVTTPGGGWIVASSVVTSTISLYLYVLPNNGGGLTGLTLSCSATNGGISAAFIEFSGLPPVMNVEYVNTRSGTSNNIPQMVLQNVVNTNDLHLIAVGHDPTGSIATQANRSVEWAGNINGAASTTATTNVRIDNFWAINADSDTPNLFATFSASVVWAAIAIRFVSTSSGAIANVMVGGNPGVMAGQFFQGMIGG